MNENNWEEIAILHQELQYNSWNNLFQKSDNEMKWTKKAKLFVLKSLQKTNFNNIDKKLLQEVTTNFLKILKPALSKNLHQIKSISDFQLNFKVKNRSQYKDLKNQVRYPFAAYETKLILQKEKKLLAKKLLDTNRQITKLESFKNNFLVSKIKDKIEIKRLKLKLRTKDVDAIINNKLIYRKIYLSDDPPLTPVGWIKLFISYGLILFWALIILWPLSELIKATLNDNASYYLDSSTYEFGFNSFSRLFEKTLYLTWLYNTIFVAGVTSIMTVLISLFMGYAFSRFRFKGRRTSMVSIMLIQMIPTLASLTVFYVLFSILNKAYGISGLYLLLFIYIGGGVAGNTFIMKGYMDSISTEIDEAAKIDGLSQWKIFFKIITPLTKPMIALIALWSFMGPFGDFILSDLLLTKETDFTLAKGLRVLITNERKLDQPAFAAGSILIAVPIAILFISLRKFLVSGISTSGVKG